MLLRENVHLGAAAPLEGRDGDAALAALVLDIFEALDQVRDAGQADEDTEPEGP